MLMVYTACAAVAAMAALLFVPWSWPTARRIAAIILTTLVPPVAILWLLIAFGVIDGWE